MAQLWRVREGKEPTGPESRWMDLPLAECVQKLGMCEADFVKPYPKAGVSPVGPTFGGADALSAYRDPTILVVEVGKDEAAANGWQAGFYIAPVSLSEADKLLA